MRVEGALQTVFETDIYMAVCTAAAAVQPTVSLWSTLKVCCYHQCHVLRVLEVLVFTNVTLGIGLTILSKSFCSTWLLAAPPNLHSSLHSSLP